MNICHAELRMQRMIYQFMAKVYHLTIDSSLDLFVYITVVYIFAMIED